MRDVTVFVTTAAVAVDAMLLAAGFVVRRSTGGGPVLLDLWGLVQGLLIAVGLGAIAWGARSVGWWVLAGLYAFVAVQDGFSWHSHLGSRLASAVDLTGLTRLIGASPSAWGSFLVLLGVAFVGASAVVAARQSDPSLRGPASVFGGLLAAVFFFAAVVNLWASARPDLPLAWVEESGEALVLSLTLGYVSGLIARGWTALGQPNRGAGASWFR